MSSGSSKVSSSVVRKARKNPKLEAKQTSKEAKLVQAAEAKRLFDEGRETRVAEARRLHNDFRSLRKAKSEMDPNYIPDVYCSGEYCSGCETEFHVYVWMEDRFKDHRLCFDCKLIKNPAFLESEWYKFTEDDFIFDSDSDE